MKKVYIIWQTCEYDGSKCVYDIYAEEAKEEAKKQVDELNAASADDDRTYDSYSLESYEINHGSNFEDKEDDLK